MSSDRKVQFAAIATSLAMIIPFPLHAQAAIDPATQIIVLLQQIIAFQTLHIEGLYREIVQLKAVLAESQKARVKNCTIVTPPHCTTALTVSRDSNNCITAYSCTSYSQASYYSQANYYSQASYGPHEGRASCLQSSPYWQGQGNLYPHESVVCSANASCWLAARCCNGKWYAGGNIIGAGPNCAFWAGRQSL